MNKLDKFTSKLNFKKIAIAYVVLAIIGIVITGFAFYNTFKGELNFIDKYAKIIDKMEDGRYDSITKIEEDLSIIANDPNMVDVILLDNQNNILYSAKNSNLAQTEKFTLKKDNSENPSLLRLEENPNALFEVLGHDSFYPKELFKLNKKEYKYDDTKFYESIDDTEKTYYLTYALDNRLGVKAYFINNDIEKINFSPILKGVGLFAGVFFVSSLFFVVYWILLALYVYEQARRANLNPTIWGLITLCTNLIGLLVFLIYKQSIKTCPKCGSSYRDYDEFCNKCAEPLNKDTNIKKIN